MQSTYIDVRAATNSIKSITLIKPHYRPHTAVLCTPRREFEPSKITHACAVGKVRAALYRHQAGQQTRVVNDA